MKNRRTTMLWMKDLIEHMNRCHEQLQWADSRTQPFLTESLMTDLRQFQQLCEELHSSSPRERPLAVPA